MIQEKIQELIDRIDNSLDNNGIGYIERHPEDNIEERRDWDSLQNDWKELIYDMMSIRDTLCTLK